jgi:hypothetical protein
VFLFCAHNNLQKLWRLFACCNVILRFFHTRYIHHSHTHIPASCIMHIYIYRNI